ncbi:MAG TPA: class E sortase [Actinomycetota bacterium]
MRALRIAGNVFILLGLTFLFFVVYEVYGTSAITKQAQAALAIEWERPLPPAPTQTAEPEEAPPPPPGSAVARIVIPKIGVDWIVVEGVSLDSLAKGPGHYTGTAYPGELGTVGIAGHRTGWNFIFADLDQLQKGDTIILERRGGKRFTYRVTDTTIVKPGNVSVLNGDPNSSALKALTLTTCTPKYTSLERLIVWADQVDPPLS